MELTPEQRSQWKTIIIGCLQKFISLCEEHGLTYYCVGGTAIGAVRHQGLIPWDDDIDVAMPRPDYDRFLKLCRNTDLGDYELATPDRKGYPCHFAKLCDKRTTLIEKRDVPCVYGLYIDVFPIDGTAPDMTEAKRLLGRYKQWSNKLDAALTRHTLRQYLAMAAKPKEWGRMAVQTAAILLGRETVRRFIIGRLDRMARRYDYSSATLVANYDGAYREREIFPKAWTDTLCDKPFGHLTVKLPGNYDAYLKNIYTNYMEFPPVEQRVCHHLHDYLDLNKRVAEKDIMASLKTNRC